MKSSIALMLLCACAALAAQTATEPAAPEQTNDGFRTLIEATRRNTTSVSSMLSRNKTSTTRAAFSDPNKPGTLKINDAISRVEIQGVAGGEITVSSPLELKNSNKTDEEGFRRIATGASFELVEKDNVASIIVSQGDDRMSKYMHDFKIQVPRDTTIIIETETSQSSRYVAIADIDGDVDINMASGDVILKNTAGAITVNLTSYGTIAAELDKTPKKLVMLATTIKNIDLTLPAAAAANVRMSTRSGEVRTNFPESVLKLAANPAATSPGGGVQSEAVTLERIKALKEDIARRRQAPGGADAGDAGAGVQSINERLAVIEAEIAGIKASTGNTPAENNAEGIAPAENKRLEAIREEIARRRQERSVGAPSSASTSSSFGSRTFVGELNGGGVDIRLTTSSGTITLKQAK